MGLHGLPGDLKRAAQLYRQAADSNVAAAHDRLARLYEHGRGVEPSAMRAYAHAKRAALLGSAPSMFHVGMLTLLGIGVAPSQTEARTWLQRALDAGMTVAQDLLTAITAETPAPLDVLRAAVDGGDVSAMFNVGMRLLEEGGDPGDVKLAIQYLDKAARGGVWAAAMQLSMFYGLGAKGFQRDARLSDAYLQLSDSMRNANRPD